MRQDSDRRFWIERLEASEYNCDIGEELEQMESEVKIALPVSHNSFPVLEEYVQWRKYA